MTVKELISELSKLPDFDIKIAITARYFEDVTCGYYASVLELKIVNDKVLIKGALGR